MQRQTALAELIPKGLGAYWLLFFFGSGFIALLGTAHFYLPNIIDALNAAAVPALDLSSRNCILNWFVSLLLFTASVVSYTNYKLGRKHQDPAGITAAWFWAAVGFLFVSLDIYTALRHTVGICLTQWSGTPLYRDGMAWWLVAYLFYFGVIGTRIFSAMSAYPFILGLFILSVTGIVADIILGLRFLPLPLVQEQRVVLQAMLFASAVLLLLLSFMLFARRQVFRDPDVALQWFARHWKQEKLLQKINELTSAKENFIEEQKEVKEFKMEPPADNGAAEESKGWNVEIQQTEVREIEPRE